MLILEYSTDGPLLKEALEQAPETEIHVEEQYADDETTSYLFWADGGDLSAFEAGLEADSTITDVKTLAETETRLLYRVVSTPEVSDTATHPFWRDFNLLYLEGTATSEGWTFRVGLPDRDAVSRFRSLHRERGRPFQLLRLYRETDSQDGAGSWLTDAQREALVAAYDCGYFDVPQTASQAEVSEHLDISPQALSERLQRGTKNLIESSLMDE